MNLFVPENNRIVRQSDNVYYCIYYVQAWNATVRITSKLDYYVKIKTNFEYEPYLDI